MHLIILCVCFNAEVTHFSSCGFQWFIYSDSAEFVQQEITSLGLKSFYWDTYYI
jgi:hypothetical protein